ncbi:MAG: META domain-containing protein [Gemmatimonadota bacterium]
MHPKSRLISIPLGIALAGALTACAPREDAVEEGGATDTVAADQPAPSGAVEPAAAETAGAEPAAADSVPAELLGTTWRLVEFDAGDPVPEGIEITAEFREGGIAGRSACNRYTGPVEIDLAAGTIETGPLVSTKMACPPPQMESEARYLGALERAKGLTLEAGRLTIQAEDEAGGMTTLLYEPETVFGFFTDPASFNVWMGAAIGNATTVPETGGEVRVEFPPLGVFPARVVLGEVVAIEPPRRFAFTWGYEGVRDA